MKRGSRKCLCCGEIFRPDPRTGRRQRYCGKAACRQTSHRASQRRWLSKAQNRDYFRGPVHVARVQAWRQAHPGYSKRVLPASGAALQDECHAQGVESNKNCADLALQEIISAQPLVLLGLIAQFTDSALQDDIAAASRRLIELGQDVLGGRPWRGVSAAPGAGSRQASSAERR
jgi:hypothetical protein